MVERTCSVEGCEQKHKARGFCIRHYVNNKRSGNPLGTRSRIPPREGLKWCPRCRDFIAIDLFGLNRSRKDGFSPYCRPCTRVMVDEGDPDHIRRNKRAKRVRSSERYLAYQREWNRQKRVRDPEATRAQRKRWEQTHREELRASARKHGPRRRARRATAPTIEFTQEELAGRLAYFGHRCWMCGEHADSIDHVKPLSKGGWHALANLRPACRSCNSRKGPRWPWPTTPFKLCAAIPGWPNS